MNDRLFFGCHLSIDENESMKALSEYHGRSMAKQFKHMLKVDYEEMKRNLSDS
jgi:hypothetical protein